MRCPEIIGSGYSIVLYRNMAGSDMCVVGDFYGAYDDALSDPPTLSGMDTMPRALQLTAIKILRYGPHTMQKVLGINFERSGPMEPLRSDGDLETSATTVGGHLGTRSAIAWQCK